MTDQPSTTQPGATGLPTAVAHAPPPAVPPAPLRLARAVLRYYPVALIFVAWELCSRLGLLDPIFVPALSDVLATLYDELFAPHHLLVNMGFSFARPGIGFGLPPTLCVTVGTLIVR